MPRFAVLLEKIDAPAFRDTLDLTLSKTHYVLYNSIFCNRAEDSEAADPRPLHQKRRRSNGFSSPSMNTSSDDDNGVGVEYPKGREGNPGRMRRSGRGLQPRSGTRSADNTCGMEMLELSEDDPVLDLAEEPLKDGHGDGKVFVEQQLPDDLIGIELLGPFDEDLLFHNFREELFSELEEEDSTLSDPANSSLGNDLTTETVHNYS